MYLHFDCQGEPSTNICDYYDRLITFTECHIYILLVAWCYIDIVMHKHTTLIITKLNFYRIFSQALSMAIKVWDDETYVHLDKKFCSIAGYSREEFVQLEVIFIQMLGFDNMLLDLQSEIMLKNMEAFGVHSCNVLQC